MALPVGLRGVVLLIMPHKELTPHKNKTGTYVCRFYCEDVAKHPPMTIWTHRGERATSGNKGVIISV
jgi:hypothetical protein